MSTPILVLALVVVGGLLIWGQRLRMRRLQNDFPGEVSSESEACHEECIGLIQEALASGDEKAMRRAMDQITKRTLKFTIGRSYPETELEQECMELWHRAARQVYGEPSHDGDKGSADEDA